MSDQSTTGAATTPTPKAKVAAPTAAEAVETTQGDPGEFVAMSHEGVDGYAVTTREALDLVHGPNGWTEVSTEDLRTAVVATGIPEHAVSPSASAADLVDILKNNTRQEA
jgi:hypothetical protein